MIETSWLTRHERGVLVAALRTYADAQSRKSTTAAQTDTRARSQANAFVANDLLRQLAGR